MVLYVERMGQVTHLQLEGWKRRGFRAVLCVVNKAADSENDLHPCKGTAGFIKDAVCF